MGSCNSTEANPAVVVDANTKKKEMANTRNITTKAGTYLVFTMENERENAEKKSGRSLFCLFCWC
jgi:hypothetical protein